MSNLLFELKSSQKQQNHSWDTTIEISCTPRVQRELNPGNVLLRRNPLKYVYQCRWYWIMRLPLTALHNLKRQDSLQWAADQTIFDDAFASLNIRWVSVVEFHDRALSIGKVFGQESPVVKWNYQILGLQSKSANFGLSKWIFYVKNHPNLSKKKFHWRISI